MVGIDISSFSKALTKVKDLVSGFSKIKSMKSEKKCSYETEVDEKTNS